ncbi:hypothetical protein AB0M36_19835 [Actinoplanes sp. NPDC051346]|uniref:hypothetical protein n=1 Tax=Actinoplanes sp. NPDC051346 TaxID=3155048 RepID=UPI00343EE7B8
MHAVSQAHRGPIAAALRHTLVGAYLTSVAFVCLSADGWQARAVETGLALMPAAMVVAGLWIRRFARHVRDLEPRDRKRPLLIGGAILLVALILGGWIYVETRSPPPVQAELFTLGVAR